MTRELRITPCDDGASQSYFGGLLISATAPCVNLTITSGTPGREQTASLKLAVHPAAC